MTGDEIVEFIKRERVSVLPAEHDGDVWICQTRHFTATDGEFDVAIERLRAQINEQT